MKVGDLVTLSAYGKNVKRTGWVQPGDVGVIKKVRNSIWLTYEIMWNRSRWEYSYHHQHCFDRRDLKFVKQLFLLDKFGESMYNDIMELTLEHLGDILLVLMLVFGFILIVYVNADYLPDEERKDEDDWF